MQNLINQLAQPHTKADGTLVTPTALMLRAARTLSEVNNMRIMDSRARLLSEQEVVVLTDALNALRELQKPVNWIEAFDEYYTFDAT